jgi:hypothetical protein
VFGGVAAFEGAFEFAQIFRERRGFAAAPVCGWLFVKKIGVGHRTLITRSRRQVQEFTVQS